MTLLIIHPFLFILFCDKIQLLTSCANDTFRLEMLNYAKLDNNKKTGTFKCFIKHKETESSIFHFPLTVQVLHCNTQFCREVGVEISETRKLMMPFELLIV